MRLDRAQGLAVRGFRPFPGNPSRRMDCLLIWLLLFGCSGGEASAVFSTSGGPKRVLLEVAATDRERNRGLMFRSRLEENRGMLFVFEQPGQPAFWMKNTYLSLDILFLSDQGVVVDLFENVPPCPMEPCPRYAPNGPSKYVIEVVGGFAARHAVRKGDRVRLENVPGVRSG